MTQLDTNSVLSFLAFDK